MRLFYYQFALLLVIVFDILDLASRKKTFSSLVKHKWIVCDGFVAFNSRDHCGSNGSWRSGVYF